ncbi:hypothetical protein [Paraflavitalea sp. CAU 1676]|uniref:hypothetical protein n=1 Tax=Paraflavitalea sp. CAU 1676 TaxID=3032598 RepID=UPI0023DB9FAF|nr:hypothetical protein [Paraflavitalea sp. CAU 1676]MDF2188754.1 hypothetical protein [Paraflavitalea sp. CAU 1676]
MKMMWCWRCKMEVPMLEDEEEQHVREIMDRGPEQEAGGLMLHERLKLILNYYNILTGWEETNFNAVMHHMVGLYGPPCEQCGKPYRTTKATFCAACGNKRILKKPSLRISFDLDDTLIAYSFPFATEPRQWWQKLLGQERLRAGTVALIKSLQAEGHSISIYTSSLRPVRRIRMLLRSYDIRVEQVINRQIHLKTVPVNKQQCSKYPPAFGIDIHVDDSTGLAIEGNQHKFKTIIVAMDQEDWTKYIWNEIEKQAKHFPNFKRW